MIEQVQAADAKAQAAVVEAVGSQAPEAKIAPTASQVLQAALATTLDTLTGGDVKLPIEEQEGVGRLSPAVFTRLMAFDSMITGLVKAGVEEARPYKFDPKVAATDNDRLVEAASKITAAGKDKALQTAIRKAPGAMVPKKAEAAPAAQPTAPAPSQAEELTQAMMARK